IVVAAQERGASDLAVMSDERRTPRPRDARPSGLRFGRVSGASEASTVPAHLGCSRDAPLEVAKSGKPDLACTLFGCRLRPETATKPHLLIEHGPWPGRRPLLRCGRNESTLPFGQLREIGWRTAKSRP